MGLGRFGGGADVAEFAWGAGSRVMVTDTASEESLGESVERLAGCEGIELHLGGHVEADFEKADIVVVNPAVSFDNEFVALAERGGKVITTQINIFFELCPAVIIGITGSNGKSTTAALTAHLLGAGVGQEDFKYRGIRLGGNIGGRGLLTKLDEIGPDDLVVLELSSFQTEQMAQIEKAPKVSLLTNLTPNHLDRHGTFSAYCAAKENMFKYQKADGISPAVSIFNAEDMVGCRWFEKYRRDEDRICLKFSADDVSSDVREAFSLPGRVNLANLAGAMVIAGYFGVGKERIKQVLPDFKALEHRLEPVREVRGVRWYNDSISTTPESAIAALGAFEEPKIIIAGGYDKGVGFDELGRQIAGKAKAAVLIGQSAARIFSAISESTGFCAEVKVADSLAEAVELADGLAEGGDVVLFSPACASYDMFDNFEHRGESFRELVRSIRE